MSQGHCNTHTHTHTHRRERETEREREQLEFIKLGPQKEGSVITNGSFVQNEK